MHVSFVGTFLCAAGVLTLGGSLDPGPWGEVKESAEEPLEAALGSSVLLFLPISFGVHSYSAGRKDWGVRQILGFAQIVGAVLVSILLFGSILGIGRNFQDAAFFIPLAALLGAALWTCRLLGTAAPKAQGPRPEAR